MHVERLGVAEVVGSPDAVDELTPREHAARVAQQQLEQLELLERHRDLAAVDGHLVPIDIHAHAVGLERTVSEAVVLDLAAQDGPDARQQFPSRIRLRHVVVGTELETHDDVDLAVLRGEHDDGHARALSQLAAHLGTREPGQHEIEQHEVGPRAIELGDRREAVLDDRRLVALPAEKVGERLAQRGLVFNDEDAGHVRAFDRVGAASRTRGSLMVKVEPRPGWDQTRISPP